MKLTRRKFLAAAPIAAGAIMQFDKAVLAQSAARDATANLRWSSFLPYINTDFSFGGIGLPKGVLRLTEMEDTLPFGINRHDVSAECFTLTFTGPQRTPLVQGTYEVNHFYLGDFPLFISVGRRVRGTIYYYAVINRYIPSPNGQRSIDHG